MSEHLSLPVWNIGGSSVSQMGQRGQKYLVSQAGTEILNYLEQQPRGSATLDEIETDMGESAGLSPDLVTTEVVNLMRNGMVSRYGDTISISNSGRQAVMYKSVEGAKLLPATRKASYGGRGGRFSSGSEEVGWYPDKISWSQIAGWMRAQRLGTVRDANVQVDIEDEFVAWAKQQRANTNWDFPEDAFAEWWKANKGDYADSVTKALAQQIVAELKQGSRDVTFVENLAKVHSEDGNAIFVVALDGGGYSYFDRKTISESGGGIIYSIFQNGQRINGIGSRRVGSKV